MQFLPLVLLAACAVVRADTDSASHLGHKSWNLRSFDNLIAFGDRWGLLDRFD